MHDVRTRKPGRQPAGARNQPKHKRGDKPALAGAGPPGQSPPIAAPPFMLTARPPAFPLDVQVPPHRGAVIALAPQGPLPVSARSEYLVTPARTPLKRKKAAAPAAKAPAKTDAKRAAKRPKPAGTAPARTPKPRKPKATLPPSPKPKRQAAANVAETDLVDTIRPIEITAPPAAMSLSTTPASATPASANPAPAPIPVSVAWPHIPDHASPATPVMAAATIAPVPPARPSARALPDRPAAVADAIPLAERVVLPPAPRARALVRQSTGPVARIVAWLTGLLPRKRKTALPRARTRLDQPVRQTAPNPVAVEATETTAELARRMLLQLSAENERLRRELEVLRATQGPIAED